MIVSNLNRQQAILANVKATLLQLKEGGIANEKLVLEYVNTVESEYSPDCTLDFYVDAERTQLLFSADTDSDSDQFSTSAGRTIFIPQDEQMNFSVGLSNQFAKPLYYVTATFADGEILKATYRNVDNLVFQSIIVTTKAGAKFAKNENTCMIYPRAETIENIQQSDDLTQAIMPIDLYLQLNIFNWDNLSEENRWIEATNVLNLIRNALYADRYRGGNCTFYSKDLDGTQIGTIQVSPSDDAVLKAKIEVKCAYWVSPTTY